MASQGPLSPGTVVDDASTGVLVWTDPDNIKVSDGSYATVTNLSFDSQTSHYLKATNFGFSIPTGETIVGILVEVQVLDISAGMYIDNLVKIIKSDGSYGTLNKATGSFFSDPDAYYPYGSTSDLWGETWTPNDINNSNFGVGFSVTAPMDNFGGQCWVNHIRITVYYGSVTSGNFFQFFNS